jgi:6-phosphogluconolactonase
MTMQGTLSGAGLREFATRQEAALNLAQRIKQALLSELERNDRATLVLSGGSSPVECFRILSTIGLPWHRIDVTLSDERNVPADHAASNEKLLRENLIRSKANGATFAPLQEGIGRLLPSAAVSSVWARMATSPHCFQIRPS